MMDEFDYQRSKLEVYRKMVLVKCVEDVITEHYHENAMKTPMHMSYGEEHIAAAVLTACEVADVPSFVYGSYRSHAAYLCKTGDVRGFFLEMLGKVGGPGDGVQGSMHLAAPEKGMMLSSAIVASQIAPAVGHALALKQRRENGIVVCFLGDGATESGAFWESVNLSCLWSVPILFVIEDNELAMSTRKWRRQAYSLAGIMERNWDGRVLANMRLDETMGPMAIFFAAKELIERRTGGPGMMQVWCRRTREHVGIGPHRGEVDQRAKDPIELMRGEIVTDSVSMDIERCVRSEVEAAYNGAVNA